MKGWRKVIVFLLCLAAGMISSLYMDATKYGTFINGIIWLAGTFFAGNTVVNMAQNFRRPFRDIRPESPQTAQEGRSEARTDPGDIRQREVL